MLVRRDLDVEAIGTMAVLPRDNSPFQIGTQGIFQNMRFSLIGRLAIKWSDGSWNEWCALFDNGSYGWLAEAQGFYSISFEHQTPSDLPPREQIISGMEVQIDGQTYQIEDIKEATYVYSEGELPFAAPAGRSATSVDLSNETAAFGCIEYSNESTRVFTGEYMDFNSFKFQHIRTFDGW